MTKDDVTRLAHEAAGFDGTTSLERPLVLYAAMSKDFLDKFADLVAKQEREACAKREWVGLTDDEVNSWELPDSPTVFEFAQFIEAKLREKNS